MAQSVERLTLDFSSGHDLMTRGIKPGISLHTDNTEPALGFSLSLCLCPALVCVCVCVCAHTHTHAHALSQNK